MFDFEWINANLYDGAYERSEGFFDDSELSSIGRPASERERALLAPYPRAVRDDVMEGKWRAPVSDGSGRDRAIAKVRSRSLPPPAIRSATGAYVDAHGAELGFEILVRNRDEERLALAYARNLARIGVAANVRLVDEVQFQRRRTTFDFDMMIGSWIASPSPGNEQRGRWSSGAADAQGAYNISGVRSPAVEFDDRGDPGGQDERGFRGGGAGARSATDLRLLYRAFVLCAGAMDRLFGQAGSAG